MMISDLNCDKDFSENTFGIPEITLFSYQSYTICSIMTQFLNSLIPQFLNFSIWS